MFARGRHNYHVLDKLFLPRPKVLSISRQVSVLSFSPSHQNREDYFSRKGAYSLNALILCDDLARIREALVCAYDKSRMVNMSSLSSTRQLLRSHPIFTEKLCFQSSQVVVSAFKKSSKATWTFIAISEDVHQGKALHWFGLAKTRFQYLLGIRLKHVEKKSMKRLLRIITSHLFAQRPIQGKWKEDAKKKNGKANDELKQPIAQTAQGGERCKQMFHYLLELPNAMPSRKKQHNGQMDLVKSICR
ncbi:hypothetical protein GQ600_23584 [Phytophthora cactorum]|nr:hypothetical protein GQ600_23584 [Phytophthora cactorum]